MAIIFPFNAGKFTAYADAGETIKARLSLAVRVMDGVSNQIITSGIKVLLRGDTIYQPVQNLSGYNCFIDVLPGKYTLIVNSNSVKEALFFNVEKSVDIPLNDPEIPVVLIPKPSYLFSDNATLIRGVVKRKPISPAIKGEPVVDAKVVAVYQGEQEKMESKTDNNGEFVFLIKKTKFKSAMEKIIKNISINIIADNQSITIDTENTLINKPFLEGKIGAVVVEDFPTI